MFNCCGDDSSAAAAFQLHPIQHEQTRQRFHLYIMTSNNQSSAQSSKLISSRLSLHKSFSQQQIINRSTFNHHKSFNASHQLQQTENMQNNKKKINSSTSTATLHSANQSFSSMSASDALNTFYTEINTTPNTARSPANQFPKESVANSHIPFGLMQQVKAVARSKRPQTAAARISCKHSSLTEEKDNSNIEITENHSENGKSRSNFSSFSSLFATEGPVKAGLAHSTYKSSQRRKAWTNIEQNINQAFEKTSNSKDSCSFRAEESPESPKNGQLPLIVSELIDLFAYYLTDFHETFQKSSSEQFDRFYAEKQRDYAQKHADYQSKIMKFDRNYHKIFNVLRNNGEIAENDQREDNNSKNWTKLLVKLENLLQGYQNKLVEQCFSLKTVHSEAARASQSFTVAVQPFSCPEHENFSENYAQLERLYSAEKAQRVELSQKNERNDAEIEKLAVQLKHLQVLYHDHTIFKQTQHRNAEIQCEIIEKNQIDTLNNVISLEKQLNNEKLSKFSEKIEKLKLRVANLSEKNKVLTEKNCKLMEKLVKQGGNSINHSYNANNSRNTSQDSRKTRPEQLIMSSKQAAGLSTLNFANFHSLSASTEGRFARPKGRSATLFISSAASTALAAAVTAPQSLSEDQAEGQEHRDWRQSQGSQENTQGANKIEPKTLHFRSASAVISGDSQGNHSKNHKTGATTEQSSPALIISPGHSRMSSTVSNHLLLPAVNNHSATPSETSSANNSESEEETTLIVQPAPAKSRSVKAKQRGVSKKQAENSKILNNQSNSPLGMKNSLSIALNDSVLLSPQLISPNNEWKSGGISSPLLSAQSIPVYSVSSGSPMAYSNHIYQGSRALNNTQNKNNSMAKKKLLITPTSKH
jgi:hypothetical protein